MVQWKFGNNFVKKEIEGTSVTGQLITDIVIGYYLGSIDSYDQLDNICKRI